MNSFVNTLLCIKNDGDSSGDEIFDKDAVGLSYVGDAVHDVLRKHHNRHHHEMWNVTNGKVIGSVHQTPMNVWDKATDPKQGNDDWFPEKMAELISKTEAFCDVMSLSPPDGKFLTHFSKALKVVAERSKTAESPVIVRMMFGNIAGMPVNCSSVIKALTKDLPEDTKLQLWVGAWRRGFSWNHAKLIAVDGVYLHTGGHNLWDLHYLSNNPVHDLSIEFEGKVARDGHRFANQQWQFVEYKQSSCVGCVVDTMPDYLPLLLRTRVTVSEYPQGKAAIFPPMFSRHRIMKTSHQSRLAEKTNVVPLISIGRQGSMVFRSRPADDAILAMINSSKTIIRLVLQDLGPVCIPGSKQALPGLLWPKEYLAAIGKAIYERGVDIEMVLSNPNSIPGGLKGTEANYGNGWSCVDVAAEIIKGIKKQYSSVDDARLRVMIKDNLRICFIRHGKSAMYEDGKSIGLHSKHFIVDNKCCYIGSQNLYMCDLAEWGIVVDNEEEVKKIMSDYFNPLWTNSFTGEDVDVEAVMDGLKVDRDGEEGTFYNGIQNVEAAQQLMPHGHGSEYYTIEKEDDDDANKAEGKFSGFAAAGAATVAVFAGYNVTEAADAPTSEFSPAEVCKTEEPTAEAPIDKDRIAEALAVAGAAVADAAAAIAAFAGSPPEALAGVAVAGAAVAEAAAAVAAFAGNAVAGAPTSEASITKDLNAEDPVENEIEVSELAANFIPKTADDEIPMTTEGEKHNEEIKVETPKGEQEQPDSPADESSVSDVAPVKSDPVKESDDYSTASSSQDEESPTETPGKASNSLQEELVKPEEEVTIEGINLCGLGQ